MISLIRYTFFSVAVISGSVILCSRFGVIPGLLLSALLCFSYSLIMSKSSARRLKVVDAELKARAKRFRYLARRIKKRKLAPMLSSISVRIGELAQHIRQDPRNLERVEELIHGHLPKAQTLAEEYVRLARQPSLGKRHEKELEEMETTIKILESALETQNSQLLDHDLDTFNAERRGFEEMLRLDYTLDGAAVDLGDRRSD